MATWSRIIDESYSGDPFRKLVECDGKHYVFDEAALIEQEEYIYRSIEMDLRLNAWDMAKRRSLPRY